MSKKETAFIKQWDNEKKGKTLDDIKEKRRIEMHEKNKINFPREKTEGIHPAELPKFEGSKKNFWSPQIRAKQGLNETSYRKLWQTRKFYSKNEDLYLNETASDTKLPLPDPFKVNYVPIKRKTEITSKETLKKPSSKFSTEVYHRLGGKKVPHPKWTEIEHLSRAKKHGLRSYEEYEVYYPCQNDYNGLYSSFTKDKVFHADQTYKSVNLSKSSADWESIQLTSQSVKEDRLKSKFQSDK